jgi:hypothetical protein
MSKWTENGIEYNFDEDRIYFQCGRTKINTSERIMIQIFLPNYTTVDQLERMSSKIKEICEDEFTINEVKEDRVIQ